jgi:predicted RNase H-like nuclease (RuvC/YqgF family)
MKVKHIILSVIGISLLAFSCKPAEEETPISKLRAEQAKLEQKISIMEDSVSMLEVKIEAWARSSRSDKSYLCKGRTICF